MMAATGHFVISFIIFLAGFACVNPVFAFQDEDLDGDGISDSDEWTRYYTDPMNIDTDGDGFTDGVEIKNGYSPLASHKKRARDIDSDNDGLNDELELKFKTDLKKNDTDEDGFSDGEEIKAGYNPLSRDVKKLKKKITILLKKQRLHYSLGGVQLGSMIVSTGTARMPTPIGTFKILNKAKRAWSNPAGLWMPYWMAFARDGKVGLHELPEWPNGKKEGVNHLGRPASHGCVRLGPKDAKILYEWTPVGTKVIVKDR